MLVSGVLIKSANVNLGDDVTAFVCKSSIFSFSIAPPINITGALGSSLTCGLPPCSACSGWRLSKASNRLCAIVLAISVVIIKSSYYSLIKAQFHNKVYRHRHPAISYDVVQQNPVIPDQFFPLTLDRRVIEIYLFVQLNPVFPL